MAVIRQRRLPNQTLTLQLPSSAIPAADCHPSFTQLPPLPLQLVTSAGDLCFSDFEKVKILGHGNSGAVYQVRHRVTGARFALKALSADDTIFQRQASREVNILRFTESPHVVGCHGFITTPTGDVAILLEYMDVGSLESLLAARSRRPFPEAALAAISRQVLLGLFYLHSHQIVHRDIKPGNLLVNSGGEIKICDFGVSKIMRRSLDSCPSYVGTCAYMSPERFDPGSYGGNYDAYAADVWSLGITMLELHLGHFPLLPPGQRPDWATLMYAICFGEPPELPVSASDNFRDFISRCLQKESRKRWSVAELLTHPFVAAGEQSESAQAFHELIISASPPSTES